MEAPFRKARSLCWACLQQNYRAPDCHVCGLEGLPRMKFGNLCLQGLSWFLGLAGPATSEILELQIVRLMVSASATDEFLRLHL